VQAHVPTAVARLLGREHPLAPRTAAVFADELAAKSGRRGSHAVAQSCALALGRLAQPGDGDGGAGDAIGELLLDVARGHRDQQTRAFAMLALGQIGGARNRTALLELIERGGQAQRSWSALALGVLAWNHGEAGRATTGRFVADRLVRDTLGDAAGEAKDPILAGAVAIAAGLAGATEAAAPLRQRLRTNHTSERLAADLASALGLLGEPAALEELRALVARDDTPPQAFEHAAVALGQLGDAQIAAALLQRLSRRDGNVARLPRARWRWSAAAATSRRWSRCCSTRATAPRREPRPRTRSAASATGARRRGTPATRGTRTTAPRSTR
jgi:HEAT repeat protein